MLCANGPALAWTAARPGFPLAVKVNEALPASTRQAVVGQRRSAGTLLAEQRDCGAQTLGALAARDVEGIAGQWERFEVR